MSLKGTQIIAVVFALLLADASFASPRLASAQTQGQSGAPAIVKSIGLIKAINGNSLTLAPESGPEVTATVQEGARIARLNPGDKDTKNATLLQLQELQVGDTIRVRGYASLDGKSIAALEVLVITKSAVAAVSGQISQDWQKRGIGGVVTAVDPSTAIVTISIPSFTDKKTVAIHTSSSTIIRRYAPDSANFDAARPATLKDVHVNDQLRARGDRTADGNDFTAAEIVTGTFPYVEGTIKSVDASSNTISVQDVLSKKTVQLKVTADSQLHQVPADMAQRMAFILKRAKQGGANPAASGATNGNTSANPAGAPPGATSANSGAPAAGPGAGARFGGGGGGGGGGLQRMLDSAPAVTLAQLHKGDALAILATEGTLSTGGTIIKLYSGVEPILEAAPNAMMLAPWTLGGAPNGDAGNQ